MCVCVCVEAEGGGRGECLFNFPVIIKKGLSMLPNALLDLIVN